MGVIEIELVGSFDPNQRRTFPALNRGHAQAVADAIKFLSEDALPRAIAQDHTLHAAGAFPFLLFGNPNPMIAERASKEPR